MHSNIRNPSRPISANSAGVNVAGSSVVVISTKCTCSRAKLRRQATVSSLNPPATRDWVNAMNIWACDSSEKQPCSGSPNPS